MKLTLDVSQTTLRRLDALCKHWSEERATINDQHPNEKQIPPMTRDEWLELNVDIEYDREIKRR